MLEKKNKLSQNKQLNRRICGIRTLTITAALRATNIKKYTRVYKKTKNGRHLRNIPCLLVDV
jgi:hypothetical protein